MFFLNPIWLFALGALGIPVVIHLWNIRPGKTLKVGSISIISEALPASSRSWHLLNILLLLTRCLLLAFIALLLAAPVWETSPKANKNKGWILVPASQFNYVNRKYQKTLDSLIRLGYEYHKFSTNFPKVSIADTALGFSEPDTANYWLLIKQLADKIPSNTPLVIYTPNKLSHFSGERPLSNLNIDWHTYPPPDSVITWPALAWLTPNADIRLAMGTSKPSGITYQYFNIRNNSRDNDAFNVNIINGQPVVGLKNQPQHKIKVDTTVSVLAIYSGRNNADASYIKAALSAVAGFTQRRIRVQLCQHVTALPQHADWLFWLADENLPANISNFKHVLYYAAGKPAGINSVICGDAGQDTPYPALFKRIAAHNPHLKMIWRDGFGNPVLTEDTQGATMLYAFYSRFSPGWSNLVWDDRFPAWLMNLINKPTTATIHDTRTIDPQQLLPVKTAGNTPNMPHEQPLALNNYLWLLAALLFVTERWLAHRNKKHLANVRA